MDLKTFLENFEAIAEAPGGIPKLRSLILDLAMRGKLASQNPEDEPAKDLLKKIQIDREGAFSAYKFKRGKSLSSVGEEKPYSLPTNWQWVRLSNICFQITDGVHKTPLYTDAGIPFLSVNNLKNNQIVFQGCKHISLEEHTDLIKRCHPQSGDILLGKVGSIGVCDVVNTDQEFSIFVQLALVKPVQKFVESFYIKYVLLSKPVKAQILAGSAGSALQYIGIGKIQELLIPLPPLAEQKRIVEKVDELMGLCDRYEAAKQTRDNLRQKLRGSAIASLMNVATDEGLDAAWTFVRDNWHHLSQCPEDADKLKQAVLQLAVQGKLAFHSPSEQSASVLLQAIRDERTKLIGNKILRQTKPLSISEVDIPFNTFRNWAWEKLGNLCFVTKLAGFEYTEYINLKDEGEVPVVRAQNVRMNRLDTQNLKFIDLQTSKLLDRSALTKPAILMTFIGAGIGDVAVFDLIEQRWHLAPNVAKLEPFNHYGEKVYIRYLLLFLMSKTGRDEIFKQRKSTAQPSLSMETIRDINVIVPPLAEQKRIVAKVDELMQLCDQLEASLRQSQQRAESLAASAISHLTI